MSISPDSRGLKKLLGSATNIDREALGTSGDPEDDETDTTLVAYLSSLLDL